MMQGLDLHRAFFEKCGLPLLREAFPKELPKLAIASVGFGSDRWRADDEHSRDHCWEPGFQLFSARLDRETLKAIEAFLFENLPWTFREYKRTDCPGSVNGIRAWTIDEFFQSMTSFAWPPTDDVPWLRITEEALFHATNGEVFYDPTGDLTTRRKAFGYYPENVWRFKLAVRAHSAEVQHYHLERILARNDGIAAEVILADGAREVMYFAFLLNKRYAPYDRWLHWGFRQLPLLSARIEPLFIELYQTADWPKRQALYQKILDVCSDYTYSEGLATKKQYWWLDLWETVQGELRNVPFPGFPGAEFRFTSQFALGADLRRLFGL